jgi:hypothetical protein
VNARVRYAAVGAGPQLPAPGRHVSASLHWSDLFETNDSGAVNIPEVALPGVRLGVQADGFESKTLLLSLATTEVTVTLVAAETHLRYCKVVDAETMRPIPDVSVRDSTGYLKARTVSAGVYEICLVGNDDDGGHLALEAPGYCTLTVRQSSLSQEVGRVGSPIRLLQAVVSYSLASPVESKSQCGPLSKNSISMRPLQSSRNRFCARTASPSQFFSRGGARVGFQAISEHGKWASGHFLATAEALQVSLLFGQGPAILSVHLKGAAGESIRHGVARVRYGARSGGSSSLLLLRANEHGVIQVPDVAGTKFADLVAPGYGGVRLVGNSEPEDFGKGGDVMVSLRKAHQVKFVVRNAIGEPSVGCFLRISARERVNVERQGRATDHPRWSVRDLVSHTIACDSNGQATVQLASGSYGVTPVPPGDFIFSGVSRYLGEYRVIQVSGPNEIALTGARVRAVTVEGFDAGTGNPLPFLQVNGVDENESVGTLIERKGSRHQLFLPGSCRRVWIGCRGYYGAEFNVPDLAHASIVAKLHPCRPSVLRIKEVPAALQGATVKVLVSRDLGAGVRAGGVLRSVKLEQDGSSPIVVNVNEIARISLPPQRIEGVDWVFRPIQDIWQPGKDVEFRAFVREK